MKSFDEGIVPVKLLRKQEIHHAMLREIVVISILQLGLSMAMALGMASLAKKYHNFGFLSFADSAADGMYKSPLGFLRHFSRRQPQEELPKFHQAAMFQFEKKVFALTLEMAGAKDLRVEVLKDNILEIAGQKNKDETKDCPSWWAYRFLLDDAHVDPERIDVNYWNGVLTVTIAKQEGRLIPIAKIASEDQKAKEGWEDVVQADEK